MDPLVFRVSDSKREREIFLSGLDIHCSIQGLIRPIEAKHATEALLEGSEEGAERREERRDSSVEKASFQLPGTSFCKQTGPFGKENCENTPRFS